MDHDVIGRRHNGHGEILARLGEMAADHRAARTETRDAVQRVHDRIDSLADDVAAIGAHGLPQRLEALEGDAVRRSEFAPARAIVYGLVALVLTGVLGALLALVIQRGP